MESFLALALWGLLLWSAGGAITTYVKMQENWIAALKRRNITKNGPGLFIVGNEDAALTIGFDFMIVGYVVLFMASCIGLSLLNGDASWFLMPAACIR
jgi:hypothetical protein